ncbi:S41 family peptidase [Micromonospora sp. NPDC047620]|uniref:S41 family peptidase n=1 Tax=Micromonospora sp. NPDC047620 TaxID=3364251 RepID=UPI0037184018
MSNADTVTGALAQITAHYVFPERATEMATVVRRHLDDGRYDELSGPQLCTTLTDDLQSVCPDRHLRLIWHERARPAWDRADDDAGEVEARRERYRLNAEGIHRVERLAGNVGLIEMRGVGDPAWTASAYAAAMQLVAHTHALILDMRRNSGGTPDSVALFCSYFLPDKPVHLNDIYDGTTRRTRQFWTLPHLPAPRYLDRPVLVLTSAQTFSAGEEICYNLQAQGRAILIGETTRGGAHPSDTYQVSPHVDVRVPCARSINPVTGTNWEGTGVKPDQSCDAEHAWDIAYREALRHVLAATVDADSEHQVAVRVEAERALAELQLH